MGKSLILFLSLLLLSHRSLCQASEEEVLKYDCFDKKAQDSLIEKYIVNGAEKNNYNGLKWQQYCDTLIAICPNIGVSYQHKAIPYIKMGDYAKAFPLEDKAVETDPAKWLPYRGFLKCIFSKDYENSIIDFQKAQKLTPNGYVMDHTFLFYEGLCNLELENYQAAEENFKRDIFIQTGGDKNKESKIHFNTLLYFGILYYEMKENKKAEEYLIKCLNIYKDSPDANYYLALVYSEGNKEDLKKNYLESARKVKSQGYSISEDNVFYVYYPHQITLYEINRELEK